MSVTRSRLPRLQGCPPHLPGSMVIRSSSFTGKASTKTAVNALAFKLPSVKDSLRRRGQTITRDKLAYAFGREELKDITMICFAPFSVFDFALQRGQTDFTCG